MIKIRHQDRTPNPNGIETIKKILEKRTDTKKLFHKKALDELIAKTGGSLRDLFSCIEQCANRARRRVERTKAKKARIELEDARRVLTGLQSDLTRMIERRHYVTLVKIHQDTKEARAIGIKLCSWN